MTDTIPADATALPPRRAFLRQLVTLPLIGGGLTLIGEPKAVAAPVTPLLMEAYKTWLDGELKSLKSEMAADPFFVERYDPAMSRIERAKRIGQYVLFAGDSGHYHAYRDALPPSSRAALVMSAVGCDWRERED